MHGFIEPIALGIRLSFNIMNDISTMDAHPLDAYDGGRTAPVAQLDRVLPSEGRGHGFESRLVHHIQKGPKRKLGAFFAFSLSKGSF